MSELVGFGWRRPGALGVGRLAAHRPGALVVPLLAILAALALSALAIVTMYDTHLFQGAAFDAISTLLPFPIAFVIGLTAQREIGLAAVLVMTVCFEINQGYVNPFVAVITIGPWIPGLMIRDRRRATRQLAELTEQLEAEAELFTEETVRLERSRIAHELHDIVAHCVSVMVIQAYAGTRLAGTDQARAAEALDQIRLAANEARDEIGHLVALLADDPVDEQPVALSAGLAELVAAAAATGIAVSLNTPLELDDLPPSVAATAYRLVQEGVTNALKHAPGAPIDIAVTRTRPTLTVTISNSAARFDQAVLASAGGGHGLSGMRQRVAALGGTLTAGPHPDGWRVRAILPLS
jgi:signal transduction histidine kinase